MDWDDTVKATEASGIYTRVHLFKIFSGKVNLAKAAELVSSTLEVLRSFRSDEEWNRMYKYIGSVASLLNIVVKASYSNRCPPKGFLMVYF